MFRRTFLASTFGFLARGAGRLRITDVKVLQLRKLRSHGAIEPAWNPGTKTEFATGGGTVVEVHTDGGIVGLGPSMDPGLVPAVKQQLVGTDPFDIENHAARLRYYAAGASYRGSAAVDIALWDIIGKASNQPLYKLWGGAKERVPAYASMIALGTPEERARMAGQLLSEGWRAIKLRLHHETMREDLRTVELVRKAVGDRMTIMVDANQAQSSGNWQPGVRWEFERAVATARELQRMGVYWLEEPLPRYDWEHLAELNRLVEIPIAGGENNRGLHEFREMVERGVYDILQPESLVTEGITCLRKIGALAEVWGKRVVPHHGGGDIGTISHLHLVCAWPHAPYFELLHDPPVGSYLHRFEILADAPRVNSEGYLTPPDKPGIGIRLAEGIVERQVA